MPSPSVSALDACVAEITALPDGAAWIRGAVLKRLVRALVRDRARGGDNVDETPSDSGRFFKAHAVADSAVPDFSLSVASTSGGGTVTPKIGVANGTVDGQYPTGMAAGSAFSSTVSATGVAWLTVTKNTDSTSSTYGQTTAVAIGTGSAMPAFSPTGPFYIFLGDYTVTGTTVVIGAGVVGIGSQATLFCGGGFFPWSV